MFILVNLPILFYICLQAEMGWRAEEVNVSQWLMSIPEALQQYKQDPATSLEHSVSKCVCAQLSVAFKSKLGTPPWIDMLESQDMNTTGLVAALKLLYKAGVMNEVDQTLETYQYDLVDVGRQCLANTFCDLQKMVMVAYVV